MLTLDWDKKRKILDTDFKTGQTWVLEKNNLTAGYILVFESDIVEIDQLYFDPTFINQGLGFELLSFVLNYYKPTQKDFILEVVTYNQKAINFYQKVGFVDTDNILQPIILKNGKQIPAQEMLLKWDKIPERK